jgi:cobalt-zinc-cadmium efflux system outer membrane protein
VNDRLVSTGLNSRILAGAPLALLLFGSFAHAQPAPTLTLEQVLFEARAHRQEIQAAQSRAEAAAQTPKVVSALPEPMVMGGLDHLPFSLMGANYSVQLQQDFPLSRIRGHRERAALREAEALRAKTGTTSLDVEAAALRSFLMLVEAQRMQTVVLDLKKLATQVHSAVQSRVAAAQGSLSESVRAEVEVARLQGELDALEREVAGAWAMTEASMGHSSVSATVPLAVLQTPTEAPPEVSALIATALDKRPELAQMRALVEAARANIDAMGSMYYPMAFVRVGAANTMSDGPGAMVMVGITLPIWREKLGAGVAEATAMGSMAEADVGAMQTMVGGEVGAGRERVLAARARFLATRDRIVPLSRQAVELVLNAYITGQQPLVSVLDAVRTQGEVQMDSVRAEVQLALAWIDLSRATGRMGVGP